ncbi:suppressor of fused domain protein, partial [bacterium]|nr:suppressor of fused domain protein [bacterium]
ARGEKRSGYGFEFAVATEFEEQNWPFWVLDLLVGYTFEGEPIKPGDWLAPLGFHRTDGVLSAFTGRHDEVKRDGVDVVGEIAGAIYWPYLWCGPSYLATSTGSFGVLVATGVTADELAYAKGFSTRHVLLLLLECGVGQRTDPMRKSVLDEDANLDRWGRIAKLTVEQVEKELAARAKR